MQSTDCEIVLRVCTRMQWRVQDLVKGGPIRPMVSTPLLYTRTNVSPHTTRLIYLIR